MKIQLIVPPISGNYNGLAKRGAYPPLDLICLGTFIKYHNSNVEVEIIDGELVPQEEIKKRINADIVGISAKALNYENCLEIAEEAKKKECLVVIGGPYVSSIAEIIVRKRKYIDCVVVGDGEEALLSLVNKKPFHLIKGLVYLEQNSVHKNEIKLLNLNQLPLPDFRLVDLTPYFSNFRERYQGRIPAERAVAIYSQKGCLWKDRTGGCIFCRKDFPWRYKHPGTIWKEILQLIETFNIDFFWDCSDSFTARRDWVKEFVTHKPSHLSPKFLIFSRPDNVDEEMVNLLTKMNCFQIIMGFESADAGCLRRAKTGKTHSLARKALKLLNDRGINLLPAFVFGLPGETKQTVKLTVDLADELIHDGMFELYAAILLPLPGTEAFKMFLKNEKFQEKYTSQDIISWEELKKDWVSTYCNVDYEYLEKTVREIMKKVPLPSGFAELKSEIKLISTLQRI